MREHLSRNSWPLFGFALSFIERIDLVAGIITVQIFTEAL